MHPAVSNGSYDREDPHGFSALALKVYANRWFISITRLPHKSQSRCWTGCKGLHRAIRQCAPRAALPPTRPRRLRDARDCANVLNAGRKEEIIFTRNATEAINLVAYTFGRERIKAGDEIVLSIMEHHSNIVPWHFYVNGKARHKWAPIDDDGNFLLDEFEKLLTPRTKMVAVTTVERARYCGAGQGRCETRTCAWHSRVDRWGRRQCTWMLMCATSIATSTSSPGTSLWADRDWRALRQIRASDEDAAFQRRRRNDS